MRALNFASLSFGKRDVTVSDDVLSEAVESAAYTVVVKSPKRQQQSAIKCLKVILRVGWSYWVGESLYGKAGWGKKALCWEVREPLFALGGGQIIFDQSTS